VKVSFDLLESCQLLLDRNRVAAHARAIASAVTRNSIVVDIGTGVGIFAMLACRSGARKVYAIDSRPMIHLAREVAAANGYLDAIEFIQDDPRHVTLPERADVVVCDVRRVLPEAQIPILIDARRRLLAAGGALIPPADQLWGAVIASPEAHDTIVGIWARRPYGIDADAAWRRSAHTWIDKRFDPMELISEPVCWSVIDYRTREEDRIAGSLDVAVRDRTTGHGLCVWVRPDLLDADRCPSTVAFFPWPEAVRFEVGDRVSVSFDARLESGGYRWHWHTSVQSSAGVDRIVFDQDTAHQTDADAIAQSEHVPVVSGRPHQDLTVDRYVLAAMDRGLPLGAIANELLARFPSTFGTRGETLTYAGVMSARYG
jgi:type I protein arginine methyltransferase